MVDVASFLEAEQADGSHFQGPLSTETLGWEVNVTVCSDSLGTLPGAFSYQCIWTD